MICAPNSSGHRARRSVSLSVVAAMISPSWWTGRCGRVVNVEPTAVVMSRTVLSTPDNRSRSDPAHEPIHTCAAAKWGGSARTPSSAICAGGCWPPGWQTGSPSMRPRAGAGSELGGQMEFLEQGVAALSAEVVPVHRCCGQRRPRPDAPDHTREWCACAACFTGQRRFDRQRAQEKSAASPSPAMTGVAVRCQSQVRHPAPW